MKTRKAIWTTLLLLCASALLMAACDADDDGEDEDGDAAAGTPAMVDSVVVEEQLGHNYAVVTGFYPDACTRISDVDQDVEESSFNINLMTGRPEELMCAQMLTQYTVSILLEVGGLAPGEYTVTVNDDRSTTFNLGG